MTGQSSWETGLFNSVSGYCLQSSSTPDSGSSRGSPWLPPSIARVAPEPPTGVQQQGTPQQRDPSSQSSINTQQQSAPPSARRSPLAGQEEDAAPDTINYAYSPIDGNPMILSLEFVVSGIQVLSIAYRPCCDMRPRECGVSTKYTL